MVYTEPQRIELEKEFLFSKYITIKRKAELSKTLSLSERQIKIWFQNRRAKDRKTSRKQRMENNVSSTTKSSTIQQQQHQKMLKNEAYSDDEEEDDEEMLDDGHQIDENGSINGDAGENCSSDNSNLDKPDKKTSKNLKRVNNKGKNSLTTPLKTGSSISSGDDENNFNSYNNSYSSYLNNNLSCPVQNSTSTPNTANFTTYLPHTNIYTPLNTATVQQQQQQQPGYQYTFLSDNLNTQQFPQQQQVFPVNSVYNGFNHQSQSPVYAPYPSAQFSYQNDYFLNSQYQNLSANTIVDPQYYHGQNQLLLNGPGSSV